jgi:hypothetical protein
MATSNAGNFGAIAPAAIDPYQIENTLADIIGKNNIGNAQNLLSQYHQQQVASEGNYNYNLQQQHDFARQQLAAQMHENNVKALQEGYKTPGLLDAYNSPQYADITAGINPEVLRQGSTNLRTMQIAEQAQKGGSAAKELTDAGAQPGDAQMQLLSGGTAGPVGTPLQLQIGREANAARLAAARIRASGEALPTEGTQYRDKFGNWRTVNFPKTMNEAARDRYIIEHGGQVVDQTTPNTPTPPVTPPPNTGGTATSLPQNPNKNVSSNKDTSAPATRGTTPAPTNTAAGAEAARQAVLANQHMLDSVFGKPAADNIRRGMAANGGAPNVVADSTKKSGWAIVGADGQKY